MWRVARLVFLISVLSGTACRSPNHQTDYNPYVRSAGRPLLKRVESLPDTAETQLNRFDSRLENLLY